MNSEITKSYEIKYEKLTFEENNLKEKLQIEVTKVKEKLENNLSELNRIIKTNEKINKGIISFEKDKERNMIKTLSYISKINKNKKEMAKLFNELMKNLKIFFVKEENIIKFEEYYFSGIPVPKNIEFKDISSNNIKVFWNIDNINLINIDKKEIKYQVEIKKENEKKFNKVYEGYNTYSLIDNLNEDTSYEIKICVIYNDLIGECSKIEKFKTSNMDFNIDSIILDESKKKYEYLKKIYEWSGYTKMKLLYRGSRDGTKAKDFHNKCDNIAPTICLYKNEKGNIFGGYTSFLGVVLVVITINQIKIVLYLH